jgi:hypothetical protein
VSRDLLAMAMAPEEAITRGTDRGVSVGVKAMQFLKQLTHMLRRSHSKAPALHSDSALERAIGLGTKDAVSMPPWANSV